VSKTSFFTMARLISCVDCQASYNLLFWWCMGTNDEWNLILFTLSPTTVTSTLNHKTLANHPCWISYIIMSSPLPEKFIWKSNSTARQKTTYRYRKAFCATSIGLFSHLKTFGILILTAHSSFRSFANIDWRKSFLSAFWIFTLTSSTHSFLA